MITLIAAVDENNAIGFNNKLLCKLDTDMKHFVEATKGHPVIMGYNTFESIGSKPLPGRHNMVLTNHAMANFAKHYDLIKEYKDIIFEDMNEINRFIDEFPKFDYMVIGGASVYEQFMDRADRICLTTIHHKFEKADSYFPTIIKDQWETVYEREVDKDDKNEHPFTISELIRKKEN